MIRRFLPQLPRLITFSTVTSILHNVTKPTSTSYFLVDHKDPERFHVWLIKSGNIRDQFLTNNLVDAYSKLGEMDLSQKVFDEMSDRDVVSWTCIISRYDQHGLPFSACKVFQCMISSGYMPSQYTFGSVLHTCYEMGICLFKLGTQVHSMAWKLGYSYDCVVCNALIVMYGSCSPHPLNDALKVFHGSPKDDVVSWNSIISVCSKHGDVSSALGLFSIMWSFETCSGLKPDEYSFSSIITAMNLCSLPSCGLQVVNALFQILAIVVKLGFFNDLYVSSALVSVCARTGLVNKAKEIFMELPNRNVISMNGLIAGLVKQKLGEEALEVFKEAKDLLEINDRVYVVLLSACAEHKSLVEGRKKGREIHGHAIRTGLSHSSIALGNGLINMYAKCGFIDEAHLVFKLMVVKDLISWNSIITGFDQNGCCEQTLLSFYQMLRMGLVPSKFAIISSLSSCGTLGFLEAGSQFHSSVVKLGLDMDVSVCNSLLTMYGECGSIHSCWKIFSVMPHCDLISWNCIIGALVGLKVSISEIIAVLSVMMQKRCHPNRITFIHILSALLQKPSLDLTQQIHTLLLKCGYAEDISVGNVLISCYGDCGEMSACELIFCSMSDRGDHVSWNSVLAGYIQNELFSKAMDYMLLMMQTGPKFDLFTLSTVLSACASIAALQHGKEIHAYGLRSLLGFDIVLDSSLVDMYSKCGRVDYASRVFKSMPFKNEISWNSMISGYACHGCALEALDLFDEMQEKGIQPDHATFLGILSACSHAGFVDEGLKYFDFMNVKYGLIPRIEHFSCIVDLLGRAGKLEKLESFLNNMPISPNSHVWKAVLGACCRVKSSRSVALGEKAGKMLLELEPDNPVNYVLLCHLHASAGRWEDVAKARASLCQLRTKKEAGCSWVTLKNELHVFVSGDKSHSETQVIYSELRALNQKIQNAGYTPRTEFAPYDMEYKELLNCQ